MDYRKNIFFRHLIDYNKAYSVAFLIFLPFLIYIEIFLDHKIFGGDSPYQDFPLRYYYGRILSRGFFPLWAPELNFGHPFFAEIHTGLLYPFNILFGFIAYFYGLRIWQIDTILHLSIALVLFYYYARQTGFSHSASLLFSISIATGGYFAVHTAHNSFLHTLAWTGGLFLFEKRFFQTGSLISFFWFCILLLLSFFAGFPPVFFIQMVLVIIYTLVLLFLHKFYQYDPFIKKLFFAAGIFIIVFLIPALFYLGITYPLTEFSARKHWPVEMYFGFHIKPRSFIHLIYRNWFHFYPDPGSWEFYAYSGPLTVFLAIAGIFFRIKKFSSDAVFWLFIAILGIFFSNARNPIYQFLFFYVPGFDLFRVPGRYIIFLTLAAAWFAGAGLDDLCKSSGRNFLKSIGLISVSAIVLFIVPFYKNSNILPFAFSSLSLVGPDFLLIALSLFVISLLVLLSKKNIAYKVIPLVAVIFILSINIYFHRFLSPGIDIANRFSKAMHPAMLSRNIPQNIHDAQGDNFSLLGNELEGRGYLTLEMERQAFFKKTAAENPMSNSMKAAGAYRTDLNSYPYAYFTSFYTMNENPDELLNALSNDADSCPLYLENNPGSQSKPVRSPCLAAKIHFNRNPNKIQIDLPPEIKIHGLIYISQTYYPGWTAEVDGNKRNIYRANYNFTAVPVYPGEKSLTLTQKLYFKLPFLKGYIIE
ncbi:MAG: YfhO family protein [Spirochaetia bacterium]|nr:YfhO family protein [Spirochaetia bacterium]